MWISAGRRGSGFTSSALSYVNSAFAPSPRFRYALPSPSRTSGSDGAMNVAISPYVFTFAQLAVLPYSVIRSLSGDSSICSRYA